MDWLDSFGDTPAVPGVISARPFARPLLVVKTVWMGRYPSIGLCSGSCITWETLHEAVDWYSSKWEFTFDNSPD